MMNLVMIMRRRCFAVFDAARIFVIFSSDWLLAFVDEGAVGVPIPAAFMALVLVLVITSIPVSRTLFRMNTTVSYNPSAL